ncbi:HEAT repeats family protein [Chlamydia avium 10DC88]|uniref:HEAT repeats family protein n=1 Tax=Chlamydia avium 10DC88 TaxID=1229831 RepID=W8JQ28_9CHLA|nr:HEAT repeats family protein [Chlamydia avium 10DC88]
MQGSDSLRQQLLIRNFSVAIQEAKGLLSSSDYSLDQARLALRVLVQGKEYSSWRSSFIGCQQRYPQLSRDRDVLEDFAQQILIDGIRHPSMTVRALSVLAMGLARDFRLTPWIVSSLYDDSVIVRTLALQVALHYGSKDLKDAVSYVARYDDAMQVRIMAYHVAAMLDIEELFPYLQEQSKNSLIDGEERRAAWQASLRFPSQKIMLTTVQSDIDHAVFACKLFLEGKEECEESTLQNLLAIPYPEVQEMALRIVLSCGRDMSCSSPYIASQVRNIAVNSPIPKVSLQAAAILYLQGDPLGEELLTTGLLSPYASICEAASASICSLGIRGKELANKYLDTVVSRKAAANLAILLLVSRENVEKAGDVIADFISDPEICWAVEHFLFDSPWLIQASPPGYADMVKSEIVRKLIRLLSVARYSKVKQVTRDFFAERQHQGWSFFSGLFWEEGDEYTPDTWSLDENFATQLEATLSVLCREKTSSSLQKAIGLYPKSSWQDKLTILEAIAFSENLNAIDFLIDCCYFETPSLRSAAAGALLALFK